jgi:hypothetical protein
MKIKIVLIVLVTIIISCLVVIENQRREINRVKDVSKTLLYIVNNHLNGDNYIPKVKDLDILSIDLNETRSYSEEYDKKSKLLINRIFDIYVFNQK